MDRMDLMVPGGHRPSPAVPCRPPPSPVVPGRPNHPHRPLQSPTVPHRPPPSPTVPCRPLPSPSVPYLKLAQTVGLLVLNNDGRPGSSRTRTADILPSRLVRGSWQSHRRALRRPRTAENTGCCGTERASSSGM